MAEAGFKPVSGSMQRWVKTALVLFALAGFACSEQLVEPDEKRLGTDFFPLEKGLYWEYKVNLTTYTLLDSSTSIFFLKESVADTFTDLAGDLAFKLERFTRYSEADPWVRDSVWSVRKDTYKVVKTENNTSFVKLVFPMREGTSWNGNAFNTRPEETFVAQNLDADLLVGDSTFANTVTIVQREVPDTLVFQDVRREYFARGIGLVKKEYIQLSYCSLPECFGQKQVDSGRKLFMDLVANGKE